MKQNRQYKDSVFTDLFGSDEKSPAKALSLCNALLGTNYTDEKVLKKLTLDNALYSSMKNDVAYMIKDKLIVMVEHQSTINENMPLRLFLYLAQEYRKYVDGKNLYATKQITIPRPSLFVLYNGLKDYPVKTQKKLSFAFAELDEEDGYDDDSINEITATIININAEKNVDLLDKCPFLKEYSLFVKEVRRQQALDEKNGFDKAIKICIEKGILKEYLTRKTEEVKAMLITEYSYETDIAVKQEEAFADGAYQKALETARNSKSIGLSTQQIAKITGLSIKEIENLKD